MMADSVIADRNKEESKVTSHIEQQLAQPEPHGGQDTADPRFKSYRTLVKLGPLNMPLQWKIPLANVDDSEAAELRARVKVLKEQVDKAAPGSERMVLLEDMFAAIAQRRARMRELGESEASMALAVMILAETWRYPELQGKPPKITSLVCAFPGTENSGTLYCDKIVAILNDGRPGVNPALLQVKDQCEADEINSFMILEVLADKGEIDSSHRCVPIAHAAGGSYKMLIECFRQDRRQQ